MSTNQLHSLKKGFPFLWKLWRSMTLVSLLLLLPAFVVETQANPVDAQLAREVGAKFINANTAMRVADNGLQLAATYNISRGDVAFRVFNVPKGFVIVSADDCAYPILGYSEEGQFDPNNIPIQMQEYLQGFVDQIQYGIENRIEADATVARQWELVRATGRVNDDRATTAVEPLLTTKWNQNCYFNDLCPEDSDGPCGRVYAGCVATAMAQVMYFWGYPSQGSGSHSYTPSGYPTQTANFGATTYNWNNMNLYFNYYVDDNGQVHWLSTPDPNQVEAVATLIWHCGVAVEMMYAADGSGAYSEDVPYALKTYFGYSDDMHLEYKDDDATWLTMVKANLDAGKPLYYSGNGSGGHAFVCDGYNSSNQLHFNWGWSGSGDGYFNLGALTPGTNHNYSNGNAAIFNIHPDCNPGTSYQVAASASPSNGGYVSGAGSYNCGSNCTLTATPYSGYVFCSWTENGTVVSTDPTYSFTVTGSRSLVANFYQNSGDPCTLVFTLNDSYGDGWNGNALVVSYSTGCFDSEQITLENGSTATVTRNVVDGSHIVLGWVMGQWTGECSFTISYEDGTMIYQGSNLSSNFSYEFDVNCGGEPPIGGDPVYVSKYPTNRNVILEEFTGRNCGYCTDGHRIANELMAANPDRLWAINVHAGGYAPTSYPNMITDDGNTIHGGFSISGYPTGVVNRSTEAGQSRSAWAGIANTQLGQVAECNIGGEVEIDPATRTATITVEVYYTGSSSATQNYLTVAMLQDSILGSQADYGNYNPTQWLNGQYVHMHVLRDVITDNAWGDAITPTTQGSLITRTYTYEIPQTIGSPNGVNVDLNNIYFLAWVSEQYQGTPTRPILTACNLGGSGTPATYYTISASANPSNGGAVSGAGAYAQGASCTLMATPAFGYSFTDWTCNGVTVSTNATYSFTVNQSASYVANFTASAPPVPPTPTLLVTAEYYPDANDPYSPYVKVSWGEPTPGSAFTCDFENGLPEGWTTIDGGNPTGYGWQFASAKMGTGYGHNASADCMISESYDNSYGAIYPDNYLISQQVTFGSGSSFSFWACAQDASYCAEHFGVAISTSGNTNASDFTMIQEWTMTAKGEGGKQGHSRSGGNRAQGNWYQCTVDLSAYSGQTGYIAIRHFNCYDQFYLDVDDVELTSGRGNRDASYRIYRANCDGSNATLIADNVTGNEYIDNSWTEANAGNYKYGVSTVTRGGRESQIRWNDNPVGGGALALCSTSGEGYVPASHTPSATASNNRDGEWYFYDNGENLNAIGTGGGQFWWGVMFPAGTYSGSSLSKVAAYDYMAMTGTVTIFNDGSDAPVGSALGQADVTLTGSNEFVETAFASPVSIDPSKNLWIVYCNESGATYPAAVCANTGDANGRWVSLDGSSWADLTSYGLDYTFMVRAFMKNGSGADLAWSNCIEKAEVDGCTLVFDLYDSYGDGWNGNYLVLDYGGMSQQLTIQNGSSATYNITMPEGSHVAMSWITGNWTYECSFTVHYEDGTPIYESIGLDANFLYEFDVNCYGPYNTYGITATASPSDGGTVSGAGTFYEGQLCTLSAAASEGYAFTNWTKNGVVVSTNETYSFTVAEAGDYVANFTQLTYSITAIANPADGGTVLGDGTYTYGQTCTLSAQANAGYVFDNWTDANGAEVSTDLTYSFTVTGEASYVANFTLDNGYHWDVNVSTYPNTMTMVGVIEINNVEQMTTTLEVGAFCGSECRGRERAVNDYYDMFGHYFVFLTVYGNDNDQINFRLYDHAIGQELNMTCSPLVFQTNGLFGNPGAPYVFDFSMSQITQSTNLTSGWNWWSTYVEADDLFGQLTTGLGANATQIKSSTSFVNYFSGLWIGGLNSINNESCYLINATNACAVEMTGNQATPANHPITINPNWNWIGYPNTGETTVANAFSNFTPSNGDQVKSQNSFSTYYSGMWVGGLSTITPGMGLLYKSNSTGVMTLIYPEPNRSEEVVENVTNEDNHWTADYHAYPSNMTVMAVIELDEVELQGEHYELAAFANGECRGSAKLMFVEPLNRHIAFLTVVGDEASELRFSLYNDETGTVETQSIASLQYETNATIGSLETPYVIRFRSTTGMDEWANNINIFPNPVNCGEQFSLGLSAVETLRATSVQIVNALGAVVETVCTPSLQTITAPKVAGVYTLRITVEGKGTCFRKLVVR